MLLPMLILSFNFRGLGVGLKILWLLILFSLNTWILWQFNKQNLVRFLLLLSILYGEICCDWCCYSSIRSSSDLISCMVISPCMVLFMVFTVVREVSSWEVRDYIMCVILVMLWSVFSGYGGGIYRCPWA